MIMFIFSVTFVQGATVHIEDNPTDTAMIEEIERWYGSMDTAMFSLLYGITGGQDWYDILLPLTYISEAYRYIFTFYILFVVVGVLNVLTAVFLENATGVRETRTQGIVDRCCRSTKEAAQP